MQRECACGGTCDRCKKENVAKETMRMRDHSAGRPPTVSLRAAGVQRACACGGTCAECKADKVSQEVMRMQNPGVAAGPAVSLGSAGGMEAPPIVHEVLRSPGQPLDKATREFMEPRFGQDFSSVRVHTGAKAAESAKAVQAKAYTVGQNVVFGAGAFAPGAEAGQRLLGHELAHVVQQRSGEGALQRSPNKKRNAPEILDTVDDAEHFQSVAFAAGQAPQVIFNIEAQAERERVAKRGTSIFTGHLDEEAIRLQKQLVDRRRTQKATHSEKKTQSQPLLSRNLMDAPLEEIIAFREAVRARQLDGDNDPTLQQQLAYAGEMLVYASETYDISFVGAYGLRKHQAIKVIDWISSELHDDIQSLSLLVYDREERYEEASSWVRGPIHFWGGSDKPVTHGDMGMMNYFRTAEEKAYEQGRLNDAISLLGQSFEEYKKVAGKVEKVEHDIGKGVGRLLKVAKPLARAGRIAHTAIYIVNPLAGAALDYLETGDLETAFRNFALAKITGGVSTGAARLAARLGRIPSAAIGLGVGGGTLMEITGASPGDLLTLDNALAFLIAHKMTSGGATALGQAAPQIAKALNRELPGIPSGGAIEAGRPAPPASEPASMEPQVLSGKEPAEASAVTQVLTEKLKSVPAQPATGRLRTGALGEAIVKKTLEIRGYDVIELQNNSSQGIDLVAVKTKGKGAGLIIYLEVKSSSKNYPGRLSAAQKNTSAFVRSRLEQIVGQRGAYKNVDPRMVEVARMLIGEIDSGRPIGGVRADVSRATGDLSFKVKFSHWKPVASTQSQRVDETGRDQIKKSTPPHKQKKL
jgi:Holliday junction resolvase-like predicted endonuclease